MTDEKKELMFQYASKHYLRTKSLEKLRSYGRSIGVNRSAAKNKDVLIEDIVGVLSGRLEPQYTNRGAPVLNDSVDPQIPERIRSIYEEIFEVVLPPDTFDPYGEYRKMGLTPNVMTIHEPEHEMRENGVIFETKIGQLQQMNGVYYLLPLDGRNNGESVIMHAEKVVLHGLQDGDVIKCETARGKSAFIVSTLLEVNGKSLASLVREDVTQGLPQEPTKPLLLFDGTQGISQACKYLQWLAPIRKGQRCCIIAPPKTGKSRLLQEIAYAAQALNPQTELLALLMDQPPEIIGQVSQIIPQENLIYTTYDDDVDRQVFVAEFILNRAKRFSESGKDVLLVVDSVNALAKAFNDTEDSVGGKTLPCGLESKTLQYLKKYLASARCVGKNGTLTIIATATVATGNPFDDIIAAEIAPLANHEIRLSEKMALKRLYPALDRTAIHVERREWTAEEQARNALIDRYLTIYDTESLLQIALLSNTAEEFENRIKAAL